MGEGHYMHGAAGTRGGSVFFLLICGTVCFCAAIRMSFWRLVHVSVGMALPFGTGELAGASGRAGRLDKWPNGECGEVLLWRVADRSGGPCPLGGDDGGPPSPVKPRCNWPAERAVMDVRFPFP